MHGTHRDKWSVAHGRCLVLSQLFKIGGGRLAPLRDEALGVLRNDVKVRSCSPLRYGLVSLGQRQGAVFWGVGGNDVQVSREKRQSI